MARKRKRKVLHFKSKEAYRKWLAYGHMHTKTGKRVYYPENLRKSMMAVSKSNPIIYIRGKRHKVKHH